MNKLNDAIECLCFALRQDAAYRQTWKANIAMAYLDCERWHKETNGDGYLNKAAKHEIANKAAELFLRQLTAMPTSPRGSSYPEIPDNWKGEVMSLRVYDFIGEEYVDSGLFRPAQDSEVYIDEDGNICCYFGSGRSESSYRILIPKKEKAMTQTLSISVDKMTLNLPITPDLVESLQKQLEDLKPKDPEVKAGDWLRISIRGKFTEITKVTDIRSGMAWCNEHCVCFCVNGDDLHYTPITDPTLIAMLEAEYQK